MINGSLTALPSTAGSVSSFEIKTELDRVQRDLSSETKVNADYIEVIEAAVNLSQRAGRDMGAFKLDRSTANSWKFSV